MSWCVDPSVAGEVALARVLRVLLADASPSGLTTVSVEDAVAQAGGKDLPSAEAFIRFVRQDRLFSADDLSIGATGDQLVTTERGQTAARELSEGQRPAIRRRTARRRLLHWLGDQPEGRGQPFAMLDRPGSWLCGTQFYRDDLSTAGKYLSDHDLLNGQFAYGDHLLQAWMESAGWTCLHDFECDVDAMLRAQQHPAGVRIGTVNSSNGDLAIAGTDFTQTSTVTITTTQSSTDLANVLCVR